MRGALCLAVFAVVAGCDPAATAPTADDPSNPCVALGDNPDGTLTARVDGERFAANCFDVRASGDGVSFDARTLTQNDAYGIQTLGEIELSVSRGASTEIGNTYRASLTTRRGTRVDGVTGTASLDVLTADRAAGRFAFTTENGIQVTDGVFDIEL